MHNAFRPRTVFELIDAFSRAREDQAVGVVIFTGLTAYDVQKITQIGAAGIMEEGETAIRRGAIMGALALYLDFINLFLSLLHFVGNRE